MKKIFIVAFFLQILFFQPLTIHAFVENQESQKTIVNKGLFNDREHSLHFFSFPIFGPLSVYVRPAYYSLKKTNAALFFGMKSMSRLATIQILPVYGNFLHVSASTK